MATKKKGGAKKTRMAPKSVPRQILVRGPEDCCNDG